MVRAETRRQSVALFKLSWQLKSFPALCVPMNDLESTTSSDMGVTDELEEWENSQHWHLRITRTDCSATSTYNFNILTSRMIVKYLLRFKNTPDWASLVVQWLGIRLPIQGTRVRALAWEDPTCRGATGPVSHNYWACASGACAPQQEGRDSERPAHRNEEWPPLAATRESPRRETKTQHSHKLKKLKKKKF